MLLDRAGQIGGAVRGLNGLATMVWKSGRYDCLKDCRDVVVIWLADALL